MANCSICGGTGWREVTDAQGVRRLAECDHSAQPMNSVGEILAGSKLVAQDLPSGLAALSEKPQVRGAGPALQRDQPSDAAITAGEGVKYASARVALLDFPAREVGAIILDHRGRERAIKIDAIRAFLPSLDARAVKQAVETLRSVARVPIAATKEPPYGYFIVETAEEARDCHDRLLREGVKLIRHSQLFQRDKELVRELEGQLGLKGA